MLVGNLTGEQLEIQQIFETLDVNNNEEAAGAILKRHFVLNVPYLLAYVSGLGLKFLCHTLSQEWVN